MKVTLDKVYNGRRFLYNDDEWSIMSDRPNCPVPDSNHKFYCKNWTTGFCEKIDVSELVEIIESNTKLPTEGNIYKDSNNITDKVIEKLTIDIENNLQWPDYFIPEIEDLHVGWEGEACFSSYGGYYIWDIEDSTKDRFFPSNPEAAKFWSKIRIVEEEDLWCGSNGNRNISVALTCLKNNNLRCKYLDKEDIEKLGWKDCTERIYNVNYLINFPNTPRRYEIILESANHMLILRPNHMIDIMVKDICKEMDKGTLSYDHNSGRCFHGECKSQNELKWIMKKLKINQETIK